jgi:aryl-alcohol dehydrogenase-like predicted oxidoreductase
VTKLPRIEAASIDAGHCRAMLDSLATSLDRLKQSEIHAVLIHNVADLAKPGSAHLIAALRQAKERGWVGRIGASIYDGEQLALVESCFDPDLVQAPLNVLDRWLLTTGALARLKRKGVEVHARSAFLQGLLLMAPDELPEFFSPVRPYIADWQRRCAAEGVSVVAGCLAYVLGHRAVDAVIVGVNNAAELSEIQAALAAATDVAVEFGGLPPLERSHIDPRCWPGATH